MEGLQVLGFDERKVGLSQPVVIRELNLILGHGTSKSSGMERHIGDDSRQITYACLSSGRLPVHRYLPLS
jgi:hypothetical protein